jgi:ATP-dependent DNA helicase RecG
LANARGGLILLGVENDAQVMGFSQQGIADTITNALNNSCDPAPAVRIEDVAVEGKNIVVITVPEGADKPYNVRGKGFYIRSGATSRQATCIEMDRLYGESGRLGRDKVFG